MRGGSSLLTCLDMPGAADHSSGRIPTSQANRLERVRRGKFWLPRATACLRQCEPNSAYRMHTHNAHGSRSHARHSPYLVAGCPGPASENAGTADSCAGCPNQAACASGTAKQVDPGEQLVTDIV